MKKSLPQFIFKYISINKYLFELLIRGELWFSSPFEFNDPYDSHFPVDFVLESYKRSGGFEMTEEVYKTNHENFVKPLVFSNKFEELRKLVGVCCFSTVEDNLIMWSHYADNHKGLLLKFDTSELQKVFSKITHVSYTDKLKPINYDCNPANLLSKLLIRKSTHWKSEKEVRIITQKSGCYRFPQTALKEIKFGLRCDSKQQTNIMDLIRKFGYPDTTFTQVHTTNYDYKLSTSYITISNEYSVYQTMGDQEIDIKEIFKNFK